jgi:hypothetical protein
MNPFRTVFAVLLLSTFAGGGVAADLETYATGLNNPRGLKFGPDRDLYVAEGGTTVGSASTVGLCDQVPFPVGPYTGGFTSRISRIDALRVRHTVIDGLPSSRTGPILGNLVSGVADIAFLNGVLYGIEAGAGCSHGLSGTSNTIFRVNANGTATTVANLSAFQQPIRWPIARLMISSRMAPGTALWNCAGTSTPSSPITASWTKSARPERSTGSLISQLARDTSCRRLSPITAISMSGIWTCFPCSWKLQGFQDYPNRPDQDRSHWLDDGTRHRL